MRFRIVGTDKHTGEAINTIIEAPDKFAAMRDARSGGVNVAEVVQVEDLPIERVAPAVVQKAPPVPMIQTNQPGAPSSIQASPPPPQVIYVVERQVPAPTAPAQVQVPAAAPAPPPPPPPQVVTHVHISNNSSATSSPVLSSRSRSSGGAGCLSAIALLVVMGVGVYAASLWYNAQRQKSGRSVKPSAPASVPTHAKPKRAPATSAHSSRVEVGGDAERACLEALRRQPDYIALQAEIADLEAMVKASRADPRQPMLRSLSEQWMDAKNRLSKMESDALANDPAVQAAGNRR